MGRTIIRLIIPNTQYPISNIRQLVFAGLVAVIAASFAVSAAPPPGTPLPLPDVIFYGTTTVAGELVENGTVKALLPRGSIVSAPIAPIAGTDYTYALVVPLSMYDPDTGVYAADSVRMGEAINFYIDDVPALFQDEGGITRSEFVIPADAVGQTYILNLTLAGAEAYPLGDVNASGRRDSADALLVLRYDVGLITGVYDFPPPPRTIYLPLCDIIADGQCNSSDALRILQCDVRMSGVECPADTPTVLALRELIAPTDGAALVLRTELEAGPKPGLATVRVIADDPQAALGAVSLELRYDVDLLSPEACRENPNGTLDAAACNVAFRSGAVRLNGVATAGAGDGAVLAEITFRLLGLPAFKEPDSARKDLARAVWLAVDGVFDLEGNELPWRAN